MTGILIAAAFVAVIVALGWFGIRRARRQAAKYDAEEAVLESDASSTEGDGSWYRRVFSARKQ